MEMDGLHGTTQRKKDQRPSSAFPAASHLAAPRPDRALPTKDLQHKLRRKGILGPSSLQRSAQ